MASVSIPPDAVLVKLDRCRALLAECRSANDAKHLAAVAEAARVYARRMGAGIALVNEAVEYKIRAERRLGEILSETPKATGGDAQRTRYLKGTESPPTLAQLDITKKTSARAQTMAAIPTKTFDRAIDKTKTEEKELTTAAFLRECAGAMHEHRNVSFPVPPPVPTGRFPVVVVDPPWPMETIARDVRPNQAGLPYPTMTETEILALEIPAADSAHLFLWTTHRFLPLGLKCVEAWGFAYCCTFVWHKPGGYQPVGLPQFNCEFVLYGRRGAPRFADTKAFPACFSAPRGKHSEKPALFYETIARCTTGPRLDMFARRNVPGFRAWGNERP